MKWPRRACELVNLLVATVFLAFAPGVGLGAFGAEPAERPAARADDPLQVIDAEHDRQVLELARRRLERLGALAAQQQPADAAATFERLFRLAIADDLFRDAEPAAAAVLKQGTTSVTTNSLAHLVKIIAEADRGAFDDSLNSLRQAVAESAANRPAGKPRAAISSAELIGICEAYYQRLVEAKQFAIARDAFQVVLAQPYPAAVKDFLASRLKRIDLVGKPAPRIQGTDLDGNEFDLAAQKGKAVLVIFWASWCQPCALQVPWIEKVEAALRGKGLKVVGVNLDTSDGGGQKLETVLPNIRHFLLDYNVPWPTLVNGSGKDDFAGAYGVSDIPANVLVGPDGTVVELDLSRRNLETVVARLLAP
jgi:thiol-disulfide isomerase/thioredoxin